MDNINHPDEKTDSSLIEVLLTPEEQAYIDKLRAEKVAPELTEQAPEKKKLTDKQKKLAAFILSGLILAGIVTGTIFENSKGKGQPIDNPTPTITETSPSETEGYETPEWYRLDWSKQSLELQRLNNLSIDEFRKESLENQLLYYSFLNNIYFDSFITGDHGVVKGACYSVTNETASIEDSAQEITDQTKTELLLAASAIDEAGNFDSLEARKLLSARVYDINVAINENDNSQNGLELAEKTFKEVPKGKKHSGVVDWEQLTQTSKDLSEIKYYKDGTPYVTLVVLDHGTSFYMEYAFVTFTNYEGKEQSIWLNSAATKLN